MKKQGWTKTRHYAWAREWKSLFETIFPPEVCETAMATCRFLLLGKDANGNKYGKGFRTFLQSSGMIPDGLTDEIQIRGNWIELDAHNSANLILDCFGLTVDDVYDKFGEPAEGEKLEVTLHDAVIASDAQFSATTATLEEVA